MKTLLHVLACLFLALPAFAAPGTATLSSLTFSSGGRYDFELNSALATPGNGADFLNITGVLDVAAGTTQNSVFTIGLVSLNNANASAPLADFDATRTYSYTLATAAGGITGFTPAEIALDVSGFTNPLLGGSFVLFLSADSRSLILQFEPALTRAFIITDIVLDRASVPGSVRAALTWNSVIGQGYRIQKKPVLGTGMWVDDSATIQATEISTTANTFYTAAPPAMLFWRVIKVPPTPFGG